MNPEIANIVTLRIAQQLGSMMLDLIRLQAEKEAAEQGLAAAMAERQAHTQNDAETQTPAKT